MAKNSVESEQLQNIVSNINANPKNPMASLGGEDIRYLEYEAANAQDGMVEVPAGLGQDIARAIETLKAAAAKGIPIDTSALASLESLSTASRATAVDLAAADRSISAATSAEAVQTQQALTGALITGGAVATSVAMNGFGINALDVTPLGNTMTTAELAEKTKDTAAETGIILATPSQSGSNINFLTRVADVTARIQNGMGDGMEKFSHFMNNTFDPSKYMQAQADSPTNKINLGIQGQPPGELGNISPGAGLNLPEPQISREAGQAPQMARGR